MTVIESCPYRNMLIDANSFDAIFSVSNALVQHADNDCRLGLARLVGDMQD